MRLVTFTRGDSRERVGVLVDGERRVLDVAAVWPGGPASMVELLAAGPDALDRLRAAADRPGSAATWPVGDVRLLAPVPRPGKVLCVGYNYRGHEAAGAVADPEFPDVFVKTGNTVVGPGAAVVVPRASVEVDYEGELAVVIGARGREIAPEDAMAHVAGFSVFNDVSARDWQARGSQWVLGKSFDTFGPLGPALVTPDEVGDLTDLDVQVAVNGEVTVHASTAAMVFPVPFLVSYLSQVVTLEPGDVIATGTPQKLPEVLARGPRWLGPGDVVEVTIGRLGTLRSPVAAPPSQLVEN